MGNSGEHGPVLVLPLCYPLTMLLAAQDPCPPQGDAFLDQAGIGGNRSRLSLIIVRPGLGSKTELGLSSDLGATLVLIVRQEIIKVVCMGVTGGKPH